MANETEGVYGSGQPVGRVERVALREVWRNEARHFTPWLAENPEALSEATGLVLTVIETERSTGNFSVDLVAEDENGNKVVIENQLEKSNHDHLGKLITYLAAVPDAKSAIWISSDPRPEHVEAVNWLNSSGQADFYILKLEAIRIGDSPPAPILTLIVGPSEDVRVVAASKKEWDAKENLRYAFWSQLIEAHRDDLPGLRNLSPTARPYASLAGGKKGIKYSLMIRQADSSANCYINDGGSKEVNQRLFDELEAHKAEIETVYGAKLLWMRADSSVSSQIRTDEMAGGYESEQSDWPAIHTAMIERIGRLISAMQPHIDSLSRSGGEGLATE
ncbi:MAG: DUF4268 domain-containing protein [Actinomycetota bacterium]